jgi:hypothetical protein
MVSSMELQHVIETTFLPLRYRACISADGAMTVTIVGSEPGSKSLTVNGIVVASLNSARSIARLVVDLREEYRLWQSVEIDHKRRNGRV